MASFEDFIAEIEAEARAEGPDAVAELEAFRLHYEITTLRLMHEAVVGVRADMDRAGSRRPTRSRPGC